jgi:hypothetical protein
MIEANARLQLVLATFRRRFPAEGEIGLLRLIDTQIVSAVKDSMDVLPITRDTVVGTVEMTSAIDERLAVLGHPQLRDDPKVQGAKNWLLNPANPEADVHAALVSNYPVLRAGLWTTILKG